MKRSFLGGFLRNSCLPVVWTLVTALGTAAAAAAAEPGAEIEIGFFNGVYEDLDSRLEPIETGGLTIRVSSPEHRLTVHANRLTLTPAAGGTLAAAIAVDFEGTGHLIADVERLGRFEDDVEAPRQTARAAGTVRLTRSDAGYVFTVVTADPSVRLEIRSAVSRQLGGACRAVAMIPFVSLPCDGIEAALSAINVPAPGPGARFLLPAGELSAEEKAFFDRFASGG